MMETIYLNPRGHGKSTAANAVNQERRSTVEEVLVKSNMEVEFTEEQLQRLRETRQDPGVVAARVRKYLIKEDETKTALLKTKAIRKAKKKLAKASKRKSRG